MRGKKETVKYDLSIEDSKDTRSIWIRVEHLAKSIRAFAKCGPSISKFDKAFSKNTPT